MRTLFLALWFGASVGWIVAATMILNPGDIAGDPFAHSRNSLDGLLTDLDCSDFGRMQEADACRSIARQSRQRELLLRRDEAVDFGIYIVAVVVPIFGVLAVGYPLVRRLDTAIRRQRQARVDLSDPSRHSPSGRGPSPSRETAPLRRPRR